MVVWAHVSQRVCAVFCAVCPVLCAMCCVLVAVCAVCCVLRVACRGKWLGLVVLGVAEEFGGGLCGGRGVSAPGSGLLARPSAVKLEAARFARRLAEVAVSYRFGPFCTGKDVGGALAARFARRRVAVRSAPRGCGGGSGDVGVGMDLGFADVFGCGRGLGPVGAACFARRACYVWCEAGLFFCQSTVWGCMAVCLAGSVEV